MCCRTVAGKCRSGLRTSATKTVRYGAFKADLRVGGEPAGTIALDADMDIPAENADIVDSTLAPGAAAVKAFKSDANRPDGVAYELKGTIDIPAAGKNFKFEHKSRLSPVPGLANAYR